MTIGGGGDKKRKQAPKGDAQDGGGKGDRRDKKTKFDWQKSHKIDPMDPTGQDSTKAKWNAGSGNPGERMADSTAGGPLWQQRPLPAPGAVLKGRKK